MTSKAPVSAFLGKLNQIKSMVNVRGQIEFR